MAGQQDAENMQFEESSQSVASEKRPLSDESHLLLPDRNADLKHHQQTVAEHSEEIVKQDDCIGISFDAQLPTLSKNSMELGPALGDTGTSLSHSSYIEKEKLDDQSHAQDGVVVTPKDVETVLHKDQDTLYTDVSDIHIKEARIKDYSNALVDSKILYLPPEIIHSIANHEDGSSSGVAEAQTNDSSNVDKSEIEVISSFKPSSNDMDIHVEGQNMQVKMAAPTVSTEPKKVSENRGFVDTTQPFESVKEVVEKLGGIVDWKAHKAKTTEKRRRLQSELEKAQEDLPIYRKRSEDAIAAKIVLLSELETVRQLLDELRLNFERSQTEAEQAKQDTELAQLRAKELADGIAENSSIATKTQLEVAKSRHDAAVAELKRVKEELAALQWQHSHLVGERDFAINRAKEAISSSKEMEKAAEDLTLELFSMKESLESAHAAHIEAEEHRIGTLLTKEQDCLHWDKEIKQAEEQLLMLSEQLLQAKNLKGKLQMASTLLSDLKTELGTYMESKLKEQAESFEVDESKGLRLAYFFTTKELEEVKAKIEKAKKKVSLLRLTESSINSELEVEKTSVYSMRQREGMASITVSSHEAEIERMKEEIKLVLEMEKKATEKMAQLPKLFQQAALQADEVKLSAKLARKELWKASEETERTKAALSTTEIRLKATLKEIEASSASKMAALAAVNALHESEEAASTGESPRGVSLSLEEYYALSKKAHEAELSDIERVDSAISQIHIAKDSELKSLQRLNEAFGELNRRKEALMAATNKAVKANEGKLGVEQELRKWRADHEQCRKTGSGGHNVVNSPAGIFNDNREAKLGEETTGISTDIIHPSSGQRIKLENLLPKPKLEKKKSFFPRILMFLVRRRSQSRK